MGKKFILGIDIDAVLVDSLKKWDRYLMSIAGVEESRLPLGEISYNFAIYYPEVEDCLEFWRLEDLYDDMVPIDGSVNALNKLDSLFDIVYITAIKGNHHKSKFEFIRRYFPTGKGFIATKEKHLVNVDIMIDDRASNLLKFENDVYTILFNSPYIQGVSHSFIPCNGWEEAYDRCMRYLENNG
jgi:5'(3')-deoxyribonucleotidase